MGIDRAVRKPPRTLWSHESTGFTPWLEENIDYLNEVLETSFSVIEREKSTPTGFSIDLVVEEDDNRQKGIIECQLEESDHDHLGKVLTYTTAFEAEMAVWIVREPRYEHKKTIEWLNESTEKSFYLVTIEAIEINGSTAPLFTPVSMPSPAAKEIGEGKREPSERELLQEEFWEQLLEKSNAESSLFSTISPKQQGWIGKGAGIGGVAYTYVIRNDWARVELYIDTGSRERNKEIFDALHAQKDEIETEFGEEIGWNRLDDKRASRIQKRVAELGLLDEEEWESIQTEMIAGMKHLERTVGSRLTNNS